ncbi:MAG: hypothetical protein JWO49_1490 [Arthrobacter sp.]|nr:hypothetical protein [Arthrobacter sp.]MCU1547687.1 hypothetical protein [Arthrobacter sp.]
MPEVGGDVSPLILFGWTALFTPELQLHLC